MKCINSKKNIVKIVANNNDLIVQEKKHLYINDLKVDIQEDDYIGVSYGNIIKTNSDKKEVSIWNNTNFLLLSKEHSSLNFINNSLFVLVDFDYENVYSLYKIKVNDNIYNVKIEGFKNIIHFDSEKIWVNDMFENNIIDCISINNENLWSYSLPEGFKIEGKIHLYDNILVVNQIDEQSCSIIVGLDILTGKKLWENKVSLIHYQQKNDFLYGFASNTFGDNVFSKINIKTGEVFEKNFENFAKQVASHLATIHNDNLYFSAYKIGEIGIIDLQKQEITQEFSLNLEKGVGIGAPVVTEDKIYILDSLNTLHIFKK